MPRFNESSTLLPRRDSSSADHIWRHNNTMSGQARNLTGAASRAQQILRLDGNTGAYRMHPFKIYNVPGPFLPAATDGFNPVTDGWRAFQVRGGVVGIRSRYRKNIFNTVNPFGYDTGTTPSKAPYQGQFEASQFIVVGGDNPSGSLLTGGGITCMDYQEEIYSGNSAQTIIPIPTDGSPVETTLLGTAVFLMPIPDGTYPTAGWSGVSIWIKITDNDTETRAKLAARVWGDVVTSVNPIAPFPPPSPLVIPVGVIFPADVELGIYSDWSTPKLFTVEQMLFNNPVGRYGAGYGDGDMTSGPLIYRGDWDDDSLSGQFFFPGDVVRVQKVGSDTHNYYSLWVNSFFLNTAVTTSPYDDSTYWVQIGGWSRSSLP